MASSIKSKGAGTPGSRKSELGQLRQIEKQSFLSRTRFWERKYLKAVYKVWRSWPMQKRRSYAEQMGRLCGISPRASSHSIRIIIDCSSPRTPDKMRSRWTLALREAYAKGISSSKLLEFFQEEGGLAGRASAFEARRRKAAAAKKAKAQSRGR
jgi:hypothetical protein